jgi:hypothetical protein
MYRFLLALAAKFHIVDDTLTPVSGVTFTGRPVSNCYAISPFYLHRFTGHLRVL